MIETATDQQAHAVAEDAAKKWALSYPIPAWGLAEGEQADRLAENWARVVAGAVLDALRAAGRLLPEGGETRTEWAVWWHAGDSDGVVLSERQFGWRDKAERRGQERIGQYGITRFTLQRREHRIFEDGSSWTGPWVAVDQPKED